MQKQILIFLMLLPVLVLAAPAQPLDRVVAVVNEDVITASELDVQVEALKQQLADKQMQLPPDAVLRKQVLQHLIDVNLQLQLAKNNNISIDNAELNDAIAKIATSNQLSLTQLREEISKQGLTWETYRDNIRKEMLISRLQQKAIGQEVVVSSQQVEDYLKVARNNNKNQWTYHLQNIVIPLPEEPTTEQLKKAQEKAQLLLGKIKQGEDFSRLAIEESSGEYALEGGDLGERHLAELPEVFAKKVINMKAGEVAGPIRTGNGFQLIKLIAIGGKDEKHQVTKTHVRHILLKQSANITSAEAEKQINNIYQQLKSGKDFALMAKQYSLDAASAINGGDLGWVTADELVPQFATAMDNLPLHTISKPVKSPFGWHLIEVLERKTMDDSDAFQRQQVRQFLHQRKFTEAVQNWLQHLRTDAYVNVMEKELA
ncbi:peptidylprolyl isomerase [Legionella oakridgensis]|uniref:Chaperone SurA n=2 Tax=Legionella oakridgensis TaxID=29423 RepID=W0BB79_9GAMM|nr:peptidylprolyl isomerase [Legionella oakridgensis]AHE65951.1 parvulin-like peptidyl-prolyl isomerase [Legionella oakridgensis ATCC 33761 = DSM 21215]ETO94322.1 periplasmic chaperone for outer membrane protein SurA [Legionella oakridgensis RV-2-2007]KTD43801.1 peptidyl-prolyl cis-trans isomerase D [Legionella oakridgensis]STY15879.1 peptidyl-prolyl cis-trans isomerase D [Legionella longbeachae]